MSQIYNDNTKKPKLKENQLGILESLLANLCILLEIQQKALGPGESAVGATYLFLRMHPKSCPIFPLKVPATLLRGLGKDAVGA